MSVERYGPGSTKGLRDCFLCGKDLPEEAKHGPLEIVYWMGCTGDICLCPGCAVQLGTRLIMDARSWEHEGAKLRRIDP